MGDKDDKKGKGDKGAKGASEKDDKDQNSPPPIKRKRNSRVNYPMKQYSFPDSQWVTTDYYYPCPHVHLKWKEYARDYFTEAEHLDFLATPKGYRWHSKNENIIKRVTRKEVGKKRLIPKEPPFPGYWQFMAEIWNLLTPEMVVRLKEILEEEEGMTSEEAVAFLLEQRAKAWRNAKAELLGPAPHVGGKEICWARDMASVLAGKFCPKVIKIIKAEFDI